ncbi:MAG: hypothetical protein OHK0012_17290 [Synechococcales cyanobacterium]
MNRLSQMGMNTALALILVSLGWTGHAAQAQGPQPQITPINTAPQDNPQVNLNLMVAKRVETIDAQGQPQKSWQEFSSGTIQVVPGDVLRYNLAANNRSDRPALNLVVTQPIPTQTVYVLESAQAGAMDGITLTYSIDQGASYTPNPMIEVKQEDGTVVKQPAPAELYTHVRWTFTKPIAPQTTENVSYQVQVK